MGLTGAMEIGKSALFANQTAIETTGNNLANIATRGYHKQVTSLAPSGAQEIQNGIFVGRGVQVQQILRQVDTALEARIRSSVSNEAGSIAARDILMQIESLENEFSDSDLSTLLGKFFDAWTQLTNSPTDNSMRTVVLSEATTLCQFINNLGNDLSKLQNQVDDSIEAAVSQANDILNKIEDLNTRIIEAERGQGNANSLRDERDILLAELSQYVDISINEQPSGSFDVFVGSNPIILNGKSRGLELVRETVDNQVEITLVSKADQSVIQAQSGRIGSLMASRDGDVGEAIDMLNDFTYQLIYEVNRIHSQGQGQQTMGQGDAVTTKLVGFTEVTSAYAVKDPAATTLALNSPDTGLDFVPQNGSFKIYVTSNTQPPVTNPEIVTVSLGNGADTTLADLAADIDALAGVKASITADGKLKIAAEDKNSTITFGEDSSGVLAALGINTFFTGSRAVDISLNDVVANNVSLLATGQNPDYPGDGSNATAMAELASKGLDAFNGLSLSEQWFRHVEDYAVRLGLANSNTEAATVVLESLSAQQQRVSGVNSDEEAINLLQYQRAYQGAARFLTVVDEMLETLLSLV